MGNGADYPVELVDVNLDDDDDPNIVRSLDCNGRRCVPVPPKGFRPVTFFLVGLLLCFVTVTVFTSYDQWGE